MLGNIGWRELVVIALIVVLVFGAGRLPELFRGLGKSLIEFRKALKNNRPLRSTPGTTSGSTMESRRRPEV